MERTKKRSNEDKIRMSLLDKEKANIIDSVEGGNMIAILSGLEIMYVVLYRNEYRCFIHKFDAEEGRQKAFDRSARNRAMINNLNSAADQVFEVGFNKDMDFMGVMVTAEKAIISYLDMTGQLPAEDVDFMSWQGTNGQEDGE